MYGSVYIQICVYYKRIVLCSVTHYNSLFGQEPFDDVDPMYRQELTDEVMEKLNGGLSNGPRTKFLLQQLFEYIILKLNRAAAVDSERQEKKGTS